MLALALTAALATDIPDDTTKTAPEVVVHCDCPHDEARAGRDRRPEGEASSAKGLHAGLSTLFLPEAPAQLVHGQLVGKKDAFVGGELRLDPRGIWMGRAHAGVDLLGRGKLDLHLGLFVGSVGDWDARSYVRPIGGTHVALGGHFERLHLRYRWLTGLGGGPSASILSEQELRVGYKLLDPVHVLGSWTLVDPLGPEGARGGVGLGVEVRL